MSNHNRLGQPPYRSPDFARWLNGPLTRFCGVAYHDRCNGTISTIGIQSACLCRCHPDAQQVGTSE